MEFTSDQETLNAVRAEIEKLDEVQQRRVRHLAQQIRDTVTLSPLEGALALALVGAEAAI